MQRVGVESSGLRSLCRVLERGGLLSASEAAEAGRVVSARSALAEQVAAATGAHLHIKVGDVGVLARGEFGEWEIEADRPGFVAWHAPGGVGVSFSSVAVTEDDLGEASPGRGGSRTRPFLDHVGLDLPETVMGRAAFAGAPAVGAARGWRHVAQGGDGARVHCCYATVAAKHWLFPPGGVPIELSLGEVVDVGGEIGGDLRPRRPA
ncbi:MAG: hypothetical protein IPJ41_02875 [Phycisphaerales bacterium]|nr:hypothetical protein [Phycisphaerales bacterium]